MSINNVHLIRMIKYSLQQIYNQEDIYSKVFFLINILLETKPASGQVIHSSTHTIMVINQSKIPSDIRTSRVCFAHLDASLGPRTKTSSTIGGDEDQDLVISELVWTRPII